MHSLVFGNSFVFSVKKLDHGTKLQVDALLQVLKNNPFHPRLHTKPLHGKLAGFYSFRIGRDYRAVFKFLDNKKIFLLRVKHRKEVYK
ncbi:MAG: type II toxin-antitoxin system RelE/ParE family toxin [Candidatus Harrisonbacteria bacterium]|nr:type II toxin-antitoxin system RelE/ParE family toxin [Candidatus Harrisonbacteria bacterium]